MGILRLSATKLTPCYRPNSVPLSPVSYVEVLTHSVIVFEDGAFKDAVKLK